MPSENTVDSSTSASDVVGRSASGTELVALPPPPSDFAGTSQVKKDNYTVQVTSRGDGYLSSIVVDALFDASPDDIFALFTHADNSSAFRDIKSVAGRKVVEASNGRNVVEVEQIGEMRVLWIRKHFSTWIKVTEDSTDPKHLVITFELLKSDVLARFHGRWDLEPEVDPKTNKIKCKSRLTQDVSPKGVPSFMTHVPVVGGLLRGIGVRTARRIVEDVNAIVKQLKAGKTLDQILAPASKENLPAAAPQNVASFAINDEDDNDSQDDVVQLPVDADEAVAATTNQPADAASGFDDAPTYEAVPSAPDDHDKLHEAVQNLELEGGGAKQTTAVAV